MHKENKELFINENLIKSISYDENEILLNILKLHCSTNIELDPTFSKGNFYKKNIKEPELKFDILPISKNVIKADCRKLPLQDSCINTMIFDPPFLATKGNSLTINDKSNKINKRFTVFPDEKSLHHFYLDSLIEFYRILNKNGILIFKCQDKVSSGKQYLSHVFIINMAEQLGFYTKDLFILLTQNRIVANWQLQNQKNARKFHCYYIVFQKCNKKINYL